MRIGLSETGRMNSAIQAVRNAETASTIYKGTPVVLNLTSTPQPTTGGDGYAAGYNDGLDVVLPSTAGANPSLFYAYGVATADIAPNQRGEVTVHGVVPYALVNRGASRAASTDTFASAASSSSAGGFLVSINTTFNAFDTYASTGSIGVIGLGQALVIDSLASIASLASNSLSSTLQRSVGYRAWVREL